MSLFVGLCAMGALICLWLYGRSCVRVYNRDAATLQRDLALVEQANFELRIHNHALQVKLDTQAAALQAREAVYDVLKADYDVLVENTLKT